MLQGPGENAGAVDIGDGLAAVFKIESHNHPSFIEPYQGAATGVGGILRDIFTMGARPIAILNSLRFGPPEDPAEPPPARGRGGGHRRLRQRVRLSDRGRRGGVRGVLRANPLVNAFCLGIVKTDAIFKGRAEGVGNTVFYVGAKTGRDGIHGATMASAEFGEGSEEKRPTVQVGDPFMEKVLLEACLEALKTGAVVGIQDMGAAGLTCSTSEMGARAGTGIEIDIAKVPKRETGMTAYEVHALRVAGADAARGREGPRGGGRRGLREVGPARGGHRHRHRADSRLRVFDRRRLEADVPNAGLTDEAPLYDRPWVEPRNPAADEDLGALPTPRRPGRRPAAAAGLAHHRQQALDLPAVRQHGAHEHLVGPGSDAGVVRVKGTRKALAMAATATAATAGSTPSRARAWPWPRPAATSWPSGAVPIGATNCLNFGNPERPEIMGQLVRAIQGIGEACRALGRAHHGRQRLALQRDRRRGDLSDARDRRGRPARGRTAGRCGRWFRERGRRRLPAGHHGGRPGRQRVPEDDPRARGGPPSPTRPRGGEAAPRDGSRGAVDGACCAPPTTLSDGGLAVALAECCFEGEALGRGARLELPSGLETTTLLFSESPSRMVVTTREPREAAGCSRRSRAYPSLGWEWWAATARAHHRAGHETVVGLSAGEPERSWLEA